MFFPAPVHPVRLYLIISHPDDNAGVVPQTLDIINRLLSDIFQKIMVRGIKAASEHEILPDQNSHLVAKLVEIVALIDPATPNAEHVHLCVADRSDQIAISVFG